MSNHAEKLTALLDGRVKASSIIGAGYKNPKKSASEWLRTQMANATLTDKLKISATIVASSGRAFKSEARARSSKAYTDLFNGKSELFTNKVITGFGVWPSVFGDGYEIYVIAR
ncbi:hypothetical protein [Pseudoalteromonas sp. MEBiC 03485]|uniref:hypothetical protein n=1 Tax=Pseudoalteromonas sp. MEBiC 03485 TaxID=2571103 RepID=UPI00101E9706|nr:hypothetical protein [Pseudoalteromonas sp. MEBiC 03485]RZD19774.1 hypothetical protein EVU92_21460 [Pseudoalteromonas sp. MEBiC 03485]